MRFGYLPVVSELHDPHVLSSITEIYGRVLDGMGGTHCAPEDTADVPLLALLVVTGGTEQIMVELLEERIQKLGRTPVCILSHPNHNSLPAALETMAYLKQHSIEGRVIYLDSPDDTEGLARFEKLVKYHEVWHSLSQLRIGQIGDPSAWLVASHPGAETIHRVWGPEVLPVSMDEVYSAMDSIPEASLIPVREKLKQSADSIVEPRDADIDMVVRVYLGLKEVMKSHQLDSFTLRCFDLLDERQTTGCFALAELNRQGIISGCEGDLPSLITMIWSWLLTGVTPWMSNPARIDEHNNSLWLAHCTVPFNMIKEYTLRTHFESGQGVGIQGKIPRDTVTLVRLGGPQLKDIWIAEGEITASGEREELCRTQIEVFLGTGHVEELLSNPLGNHIIAILGHHGDTLRKWWKIYIADGKR